MPTEKGNETAPEHPPIPGDLPYREPPVIEGKAEHVHDTSLEAESPADGSTTERAPGSMDELKAAVENALESDGAQTPPPREASDPPPAAAPQPRRRWPVWPLVLAALIGMIPGLAALWLAQQARENDPTSTIAGLRSDVGRLSARVDALEKRPDNTGPLRDTLAGLDKRVGAVEALARGAQAASDKAANDAKTAMNTAQSAAERPPAPAEAPVAAVAAPSPPVDLSPLRKQIEEADTRIGANDQRIGAVDQRIGGLDTRLGALQAKTDQPKTDTRAQTADKDTANEAAENPAAVAVVAQSVLQALPRGAPFPTEVSALKAMKVDPSKVAALEPLAQSGAPTARALADRFRPLGDEIARQDQPREGSFFDRLKQSASNLVHVQSAGEKPGNDPAALASQIQAALDRGDLNRAHDLWTKLPDTAKARSQDWARALDARIAADKSAQSLANEAIARLAKARS